MDQGWVKLHRKITDSELWLLEPFTKAQAWIDLILLANHKDGIILVRGNIINIKRGQVGWSMQKLQKRWKWGRTKTENFLNYLENQCQIKQQKNFVSSILTITNYDKYQADQQADQQADVKQTRSRPTTNKNVKNDKNISKDIGDESPMYGSKDLIDFKNWLMRNYPKPLAGISDTRKLHNLQQVLSKRKNQDDWMEDNWKINAKNFLGCYLKDSESDEYLVNSIDKLREKAKLWREYRGKLK